MYFRLFLVPGLLAYSSGRRFGYFFPRFLIGNESALIWLHHSDVCAAWLAHCLLLADRSSPICRSECMYWGTGERAQRLVQGLRQRPELGIRCCGMERERWRAR